MGFSNSLYFDDARQKTWAKYEEQRFPEKDLRTPMKPIGAVQKPQL
jgi:hypothetical protein